MKVEKLTIIALALMAYSVTMGVVIAQDENATTVATGQEAVPVETTTGQVQEVAPADSINSLLNTILAVGVPAVSGLIIAIATLVKSRSTDKRVQANADQVINAAKYVDTMAPKIKEQYVASGATKQGLEFVISRLSPQDQEELKKITARIPDVEGQIKETSEQINKFREWIPDKAIADKDPSIPRPVTKPT